MAYRLNQEQCRDFEFSSRREWLLTNGIGGYAMGTASGANTRRYHGLLVAATKPPTTRMVLLAGIEAYASVGTQSYGLSTNQYVGAVHPTGYTILESFSVDTHAEWIWQTGPTKIRLRVALTEGQNSVTLEYTNLGAAAVQLTLRPLVEHKFYHDNFRFMDFYPDQVSFPEGKTVLTHQGVTLSLVHEGADRSPTTGWYYRFEHQRESERGLDPLDDEFCPCELRYQLAPGASILLGASSEEQFTPAKFTDLPEEDSSMEERLSQASRAFLVSGAGRKTILAGYPWFTDWGRDTMISIPGICLANGMIEEAKKILRGYASQMHQGLIPNRFVDRGETPEYNTVDATLWFANACHLTLQEGEDKEFEGEVTAWLGDVIEWHIKGTQFGIGVDASDGLLTQGEQGIQLTWMDAKVGDWVVTPRHGKPVEVNGLWINLLNIYLALIAKSRKSRPDLEALLAKATNSFEAKFWREIDGFYLDTVDPDDVSLRPNQLIAMSLPYSPCQADHAARALSAIEEQLLTPAGLRTLSPSDPAYHGRFEGPLSDRDAAYHQGTVWPWLIGSYVAASLKFVGNADACRAALEPIAGRLDDCGLGGIAEVYDGDEPQYAGGCPWQAWSVAETLRAYKLLASFEK